MIEILYSLAGNFTVNTAAVSVPIVGVSGLFHVDCLVFSRNHFKPLDHCILESVSLSIPMCFSTVNLPAVEPLTAQIVWKSAAGLNYEMNELNGNGYGYFGIHCENQEIPLNVFVTYPTIAGNTGMAFEGKMIKGNISMINVPAALNALVFPVYLMLKVKHNLDMITLP
jgi:hypothetical protein